MAFIYAFIVMTLTGFFFSCITVIPLQQIFGFKDDSEAFNILMNIFFTIGFFLPVVYWIYKSKHKSKYSYSNKFSSNLVAKPVNNTKQKPKKNKPGLLAGLVGGIVSTSNQAYKDAHEPKKYTDNELNNWDLTEEQKKAVKSGNFEPWNFEEENLEEDDYYHGDDE